jgi:NitT/TauT family transport system substrate-binding protein
MRLINRLAYCLAAAIPVAVLSACSGASSGGGGPLETSTVVIDAVPTADAAGLYIAQDEGLFAKQGLTVDIVPIDGGEYGMGDLQTGKADLIEGNYVSFVLAQVAGKFAAPPPPNEPNGKPQPLRPIDMRIIADSSQMQPGNQGLYVMPGSRYKTVTELARDHATVGVNSLHNIGSVLLGSLLSADGYGLKAVTQAPEPLPEMPLLLSKHVIQTAWMPEPFGTEAQQEFGAIELADFDQGSLENFPIGTVVGSASWVQSHPNTIAAFLRAYNQGQQIADTDRSEVEKVLVRYTGVTKLVAASMTLDTYPLEMDVPVMQRVPDAMYQFGVLSQHYNITDMIQPEPGEIGG